MFALRKKTVNQRKHEIVCKHVVNGCEGLILDQTTKWYNWVQILEVTSIVLCGCNLKDNLEYSNGIQKGTIWHQNTHEQKLQQAIDLSNRWNEGQRKYSQKELGGLHCRWNAYPVKTWTGLMKWNTRSINLKNLSLLLGDLVSDVYGSLLQPIKTSRYSLCSEV